jgi:hypothetical protein
MSIKSLGGTGSSGSISRTSVRGIASLDAFDVGFERRWYGWLRR